LCHRHPGKRCFAVLAGEERKEKKKIGVGVGLPWSLHPSIAASVPVNSTIWSPTSLVSDKESTLQSVFGEL
jgi:hypothetical protein